MQNHVKRFHEESKALPANLPPRTSRWLIAIFGSGLLPLTILSLGSFGSIFGASNGPYWYMNSLINWSIFLTFFSWFCIQLLAFIGLTVRRDWALGMAYIACIFWCFSLVGIIPAAVVFYLLRRSWSLNQTGVAAEAPRSVQILFWVTTLWVVVWAAFCIYTDLLLRSVFAGVGLHPEGADPLTATMFYFGLPTYVLQGAALYGLRTRQVWGREAATVAAVVLMFTIVGLPVGYWALKRLWPTNLVAAESASVPA